MLQLWPHITKNSSTAATALLIIIVTSIAIFSPRVNAAPITLAWEIKDSSKIDGYEIYYGDSSGHYTGQIDVGDKTINIGNKIAYTIRNLEPGTYYLTVKSYDQSHTHYSDFSPEIKATIPSGTQGSSQINGKMESSYKTTPHDNLSFPSQISESESHFHGTINASTPLIELGEAEIDHTWTRITFNETFSEPIVVAKPLSGNKADPAIITIRDVDSAGFSIRMQKWDSLSEDHILEKVGYLAVERGTYTLPDGTRLEADQHEAEAGDAFVEVPLLQEYPARPIVIASINTNNSEALLTSRLQEINLDGFQILLLTEETDNFQTLTDKETVSYIAWEPSTGVAGGIAFEVDRIKVPGGDSFYSLDYQQNFIESPIFLADIQTRNNEEIANLRWRNKELSHVEVKIEKAQPHNSSETEPSAESVGYALFGVASP